jgi:hypothetical protein
MSNTPHSSYRLSAETRRLLALIAADRGMSKTAVLDDLVRSYVLCEGPGRKDYYAVAKAKRKAR